MKFLKPFHLKIDLNLYSSKKTLENTQEKASFSKNSSKSAIKTPKIKEKTKNFWSSKKIFSGNTMKKQEKSAIFTDFSLCENKEKNVKKDKILKENGNTVNTIKALNFKYQNTTYLSFLNAKKKKN